MSSQFVLTGSPASIRSTATRWSAFAQVAAQAASDLRTLSTDDFHGDEADLYREKLNNDLPPNLDTVEQAWTKISGALTIYAATLESCQTRLNNLAADHAAQDTQVARADDALADARTADHRHTLDRQAAQENLADGETLPPDTYRSQTSGAQADLANARAARQATIDAANGVKTEHATAVETCVKAIDEAQSWRFEDPPGWFDKLVSSVGDWIAEHADVLTAISSVLKTISGIAGVLALIPVLAPIAGPIALATGGAAVVIDGAVALATGTFDPATFLLDSALALAPAGIGKVGGRLLNGTRAGNKLNYATQAVRNRTIYEARGVAGGLKNMVQVSPVGGRALAGTGMRDGAFPMLRMNAGGYRAGSDAAKAKPFQVKVDGSRHPESATHIHQAQNGTSWSGRTEVAATHPSRLTIDRDGAAPRGRDALRDVDARSRADKIDRDEYPPKMFAEGGTGASVKYIDAGDNRGAGSVIGHQVAGLPNGTVVDVSAVNLPSPLPGPR